MDFRTLKGFVLHWRGELHLDFVVSAAKLVTFMKQDSTPSGPVQPIDPAGIPAEPVMHDAYLLRILMDNLPDAIYFKDSNSRFVCINRALAMMFGLSDPAQAIGKTDADFFSPMHAQQALIDEQRVLRTGQPLVGIEEMETWRDGSVTWVSTTKMPLRSGTGQIVGTFGMSRNITERKRAEQELAERTRQLQAKTQQIEDELRMARELQLAMLPQKSPALSKGMNAGALEFFSLYFPSGAVSGDFFDIVELSETKVGIFICDVMGHDVRAALITAMMRALVQDLSTVALDPAHLLHQINQGLVGVFNQTGATVYATAFYMVADLVQGEVLYASAAHPAPIHLRRRQGKVERLNGEEGAKRGPALGLFEKAEYSTCVRSLAEGDMIALFTDGLVEAESPQHEQFSEARLVNALRRRSQLSADRLIAEVVAEIRKFSGRQQFEDDVCLVGMEVKHLNTPVAATAGG
jgi:sigma-B regulation protein RsbU (phosphoserine phosphatase)